MSNQEYLQSLLNNNDLSDTELNALRNERELIEKALSVLQGSPRFYYGGSFGKKTIVKAHYDLDIVVYWPNDCGYSLEGISTAVGDILKKKYQFVSRKKVSWQLPFQGGFHIDVVPGRAIDAAFYEANLYRSDNGSSLKTSIKKHIDTVRGSGRRDVIRLMKLWKIKRNVPLKSFPLELLTIDGTKGASFDNLERQLLMSLAYVRDNILTVKILDPANGNNDLTDDLTSYERTNIKALAQAALDARFWSDVFA